MWEFAKLNLIDEYRVTLVPKILGGADAPTMVEGEGFLPARLLQLKLVEARPVGDEVYLVYRKTS
jgi:5-amino-6-(5-phosphoribosylamino)uracil reductase